MSPIVSLSNVSRVYLTQEMETRALWDIDIELQSGEFVAIRGPSGCGKSTLLSIMGLMDTPTRGDVVVAGRNVTRLSLTQRATLRNARIGFIFQNFHLIGNLNALDNVALPLGYAGIGLARRRSIASAALARVEMQHRARHFPAQLSGGQQQRVAVARAIAARPALILADEPTGNLDSGNGEVVMDLLSEIHREQETTICLVTHEAKHTHRADRVVTLLDGRIVATEISQS